MKMLGDQEKNPIPPHLFLLQILVSFLSAEQSKQVYPSMFIMSYPPFLKIGCAE